MEHQNPDHHNPTPNPISLPEATQTETSQNLQPQQVSIPIQSQATHPNLDSRPDSFPAAPPVTEPHIHPKPHHVSIPSESEMKKLWEPNAVPCVQPVAGEEEAALMRGTEPAGEVEIAVQAVAVKQDIAAYHIRRQRKSLVTACYIALLILTLLLGLILLILALTLFKGRQPMISIKNVELQSLSIANLNTTELAQLVAEGRVNMSDPAAAIMELGSSLNLTGVSVSLTLGVEVSVYNPNRASFRYANSTSYLYYRDVQVGEAAIPAGHIGARSGEALNTTMTLNATTSALLGNPHLFLDVAAGSFPMSTTAQVSGRLNFLNVFKHHARSSTHCTMSISLALRAVQNMVCTYRVHL